MDSRFDLQVKFRIYDQEFNCDWSLNWSSDDPDKIDRRITEWFLECHDTALAKWEAELEERQSEYRAEQAKARELEELNRLREKYPDGCA